MQNRERTERYSRRKDGKRHGRWGKLVSRIGALASPKRTEPEVQKDKGSLACHNFCKLNTT